MKPVDVFTFQPAPKNRRRNDFNMSYHNYFTCKVGTLVPSYVQEVRGGDYLEIKPTNFTRTQPLKTSAFTQLREYTDFFFVPYRLLWKWWPEFETQLVDQFSSYRPANNSENYTVPVVDHTDFTSWLSTLKSSNFGQWNQACRLLDMLDIFSLDDTSDWISSMANGFPTFNIFRPAAYQCIFENYYRNSYWTTKTVKSYNFDDFGVGGIVKDTARFAQLFALHQAPWYKDMATAVIPTNLAPSVANGGVFSEPHSQQTSSSSGDGYLNAVDSDKTSELSGSGYSFREANNMSFGFVGFDQYGDGQFAVTANTIRMALAFDNYCRKRAMANKDIVGQLSALFGEKYEVNHFAPKFLKSFVSDINIGEVTATSSGSDGDASSNVLGQIAGKGIGSRQGDTIKFQADEDGIVMGIHYIIPTAQYNGIIDPFVTKAGLYDFYSPEFDGLGLQAQPTSILGANHPGTNIDIYGFVPRYAEYKSRLNVLHNQLCRGRSLSAWASPRTYGKGTTIENLMYVPEDSLDSIFGVSATGQSNTDQFICHYFYDVGKASDMSRLGVDFTL